MILLLPLCMSLHKTDAEIAADPLALFPFPADAPWQTILFIVFLADDGVSQNNEI
jgi:hypothetical protein